VFEQLLPNLYPKVGEHSYVQYDNLMITLFGTLSPLPIFSEGNGASMPFSSFTFSIGDGLTEHSMSAQSDVHEPI
jgi:hypothetical protein